MSKVEIRVRPVTRYLVTRWTPAPCQDDEACLETIGEFDSKRFANEVADKLRAVDEAGN